MKTTILNPFLVRDTLLNITGITKDDLQKKAYLKDSLNGNHKNFKIKLEKSKKVKLVSQILNYLLLTRCKISSYNAAELSFKRHPTPLVNAGVIESELRTASKRRHKILAIINQFEETINE